jgi:hypothetical protein
VWYFSSLKGVIIEWEIGEKREESKYGKPFIIVIQIKILFRE